MAIEDSNSSKQHTLHFFDGELEHLRALILAMLDLLICQLEQAMQALEDGDIRLASRKVISRDNESTILKSKSIVKCRQCLPGTVPWPTIYAPLLQRPKWSTSWKKPATK